MQIIPKIFASDAAVLAALKAASPLLVSTDKEGVDHVVACGLDANGARFDVVLTPLTTPRVGTIPGPKMPDGSDGPPLPAPPTLTGEVRVDLYWQGKDAPTLAGGRAADAPAVDFAPPVAPEPTTPDEVPLWSLRAATKEAGKFAAIDAFVESHHDDMPAIWEAWNMGNVVSHTSTLVASFAPQFQIDAAERDALMRRAAEISAAA